MAIPGIFDDLDEQRPRLRAVGGRLPEELRKRYMRVASEAAKRHGVPETIFLAQIDQESGFNPMAVSRAGAKGIAQIMTRWHPHVNPFDPEQSLDYAAKLMRSLFDKYGQWELALAAYNAGGPRVDKAGPGIPNIPETQGYVNAIMAAARRMGYSTATGAGTVRQLPGIFSDLDAATGAQTGAQEVGPTPTTPPAPKVAPRPSQRPILAEFGTPQEVLQQGIRSVFGPRNFITELGLSLERMGGAAGIAGTAVKAIGVSPPGEVLARSLAAVGIPGMLIESYATAGRGFRKAFESLGVREAGPFGPAALSAFVAASITDPVTWIGLGTARRGARAIRQAVAERKAPLLPAALSKQAMEEAAQAGIPRYATRNILTAVPPETVVNYRLLREATGAPQYIRVRDATGRFTRETISIEDYIKRKLEAAAVPEKVTPVGPIEYIRIRDPKTGRWTGEVVRRGERGFTELASKELDDRLAEVIADPTPWLDRVVPKKLPTPITPKQLENLADRIDSVVTRGVEKTAGDKANLGRIVRSYLESGGDPNKLPSSVVELVQRYHPDLLKVPKVSPPTPPEVLRPKGRAAKTTEPVVRFVSYVREKHPDIPIHSIISASRAVRRAINAGEPVEDALARGFAALEIPKPASLFEARPGERGFIRFDKSEEDIRSFMNRVFLSGVRDWITDKAVLIRDFRGIGSELLRDFIRQGDSVMRSFGPAGKELVERASLAYDTWQTNAGKIIDSFERIKGLSKDSWEKVRLAREGEAVRLTTAEQALFRAVSHYLDHDLIRRGAPLNLPINILDNYWPQRVNWKALGWEGSSDRLIEKLMKRGMTFTQAEDLVRHVILPNRKGRPFGNLERPRHLLLDKTFRKPAKQEILEYVIHAEKRLAEAKHYGMQDEIMTKLILALPEKHDRFASQWFNFVTGHNPWEDITAHTWASKINDAQAAAKMPLAVISNTTQTLNTLFLASVSEFTRGWKRFLNTMTQDEAISFAKRAGVILDNTLQEIKAMAVGAEGAPIGRGIGGKVMDWTGFTQVERMNRIVSANIGREWFNDLVRTIEKKSSVDQLKRAGFTVEDIRRFSRGGASEADQIKAGRWFVEKTQFFTRPTDFPLRWSHPLVRLAVLFKRFAYKQGQLMIDAVLTEGLFKFNPLDPSTYWRLRPAIIAGAIFPIIGDSLFVMRSGIKKAIGDPADLMSAWNAEGILGVYETIRGEVPMPDWSSPQAFIKSYPGWWLHSVGWLGALGLASDAFRAMAASPGSLYRAVAGFMGGPTAADILDIGVRGIGTARDIGKWAVGDDTQWTNVKLLGRSLVGITPFGQLTRGLSIFQSPAFEKRRLKENIYDAIDRGNAKAYAQYSRELFEKYGETISASQERRRLKAKERKEERRRARPSPIGVAADFAQRLWRDLTDELRAPGE